MRPLFVALVWLVVAAHFAFLLYLPTGGFLALRRRNTIWLHIAAVVWAICTVALNVDCPLTTLERWARSGAGMPALGSAGFIDHYITGRVYPESATGWVQAVVFLAVLVSWVAYLLGRRGQPTPQAKDVS